MHSGTSPRRRRSVVLGVAAFLALAAAGWAAPKWLTYLVTMSAGNGLVSLGIVCLMRGGVVPFGQGMVFAIGGYTAALLFNRLGFTDALGLARSLAVHLAPVAELFAIYIVMAIVLMFKPEGLFQRIQARKI